MMNGHSSNYFEKLFTRCASLARQLSPSHADTWMDEAQEFIRTTADALHRIASFSMDSTYEPATRFVVDMHDDGGDKRIDDDRIDDDRIDDDRIEDDRIDLYQRLNESSHGCPDRGCKESSSQRSDLSVTEAVRALRRGDLSPIELVQTYLDQISATDDKVRAWETLVADEAIAQARKAEKALTDSHDIGPLLGIPFGVKDNIFTLGIRTAGGSRLYDSFVPSYDAHVVTLLKQAGAILIGKTTTAELALGDPPPTRNPWHLEHTPGGSSSGSAAAVAAGHVPFTLATQTGGSINRPAGYTGVSALKPTYGRIDRHGVFPVSWTMDHVGFMAKSAQDLAVVFHVFDGLSHRVSEKKTLKIDLLMRQSTDHFIRQVQHMTVGRPDRYFDEALHPAQRSAFDNLLRVLENDLGVIVKEIQLPPSFEAAVAAHTIIMQCEAAASYADELRKQGNLIRPALRSRFLCGSATDAPIYLRAQQVRNVYIHQLSELFQSEGIDVLATPTSPTPAPKGLRWTGSSMFNSPFTITGFPTIVLPTGFATGFETETGLPLSAQLVAPPLHEGTLLNLGIAYQAVTDWHTRRPF